jgi:DNA-binding response OmpR family regulator
MPLELTDSEVLRLHYLLENAVVHPQRPNPHTRIWQSGWLQFMTKLEIHINSLTNNPTNEPPLVEPCFDEQGHPVWPS